MPERACTLVVFTWCKAMLSAVVGPETMFLGEMALNWLLPLLENPGLSLSCLQCFPSPELLLSPAEMEMT